MNERLWSDKSMEGMILHKVSSSNDDGGLNSISAQDRSFLNM
jgi:hypothetical protein